MMAETLVGVSPAEPQMPDAPSKGDLAALQRLVRQAQEDGVALTGPDGLLKMLTKTVIEVALDEEMSSHLGYDKHGVEGGGNSRNGTRVQDGDHGQRRSCADVSVMGLSGSRCCGS